MYLAIDQATSAIFTGPSEPYLPGRSADQVVPCVHVDAGVEPKDVVPAAAMGPRFPFESWLFVEDSFDAVSRIRRGRMWQALEQGFSQPSSRWLAPSAEKLFFSGAVGARVQRPAYLFGPARKLCNLPRGGIGATLATGTQGAFSLWRVVHLETGHDGALVVTLKARSALGHLPDLNLSGVAPEFHEAIKSHYERAVEAAHRESPGSVIDRTKDALVVMISRWLAQRNGDTAVLGLDIGKLVRRLNDMVEGPECVARLGDVLGRLHSRNKPGEQHRRELRDITESDAELAVLALGFAMRDLGLAADGTW